MTITNEPGTRDLVHRIRSLPPKRRRALMTLLEKQGVDLSVLDLSAFDVVPLPTRRPDQPVPLSFTQQRLWFLAQLDGAGSAYNIPMAVRLCGNLDRPALVGALREVVRRHEALRTRFVEHDGVPYQHVGDGADFEVRQEELADPAELPRICAQEAAAPFDLEHDTLIRARLLRQSDQEHVLLVTMHHGVSDGWSIGVLHHDLVALYDALRAGRPSPLEPLPIQYPDYANWQREWLDDGVREAQVAYWRDRLAGVDPRLSLPTDRERPPVKTYNGARETFRCPAELLDALREVGARHDATLYMTLFAAYCALLHRYTQQTDVAVGTVVANRGRTEFEGLIGFFANTLVMRTDLSGDPTFPALLAQVKQRALEAYEHQDVPFEAVVDALRPERSLSHSPVFQNMFVLQEAQTAEETRLGELELLPVDFDVEATKFDLTLDLRETPDGLAGFIEYNTDLFDAETIRRFVRHYTNLLACIAAEPQEKISRLTDLPAGERRRLVGEWNEVPAGLVAEEWCVHEWFEGVVAGSPGAVAVEFEGCSLSYGELNARANRLARHLRELGVGRGTLVAVCLPRSEHIVVSVLAVLKAGGGYVPLDPAAPAERLRHVLRDSGPEVLLVDGVIPDGLDTAGIPVVDVRAD
ncbi:condensation domain-containing protein, partial [Streptomyces sp. 150FB]|uniref:condensation domain-containing protein n=1 Tax=Streptomyces sp. 150FB TaxID=1576605 RepID=UPI001237645E